MLDGDMSRYGRFYGFQRLDIKAGASNKRKLYRAKEFAFMGLAVGIDVFFVSCAIEGFGMDCGGISVG